MSQINIPGGTPLQKSLLNKQITSIGQILRQLGQTGVTLKFPPLDQPLSYQAHGLRYSLIFNTLPKSGSRYVINTIVQWLQIFGERITAGDFPNARVNTELAAQFAQIPSILQDHFPARLGNLMVTAHFFDRLVVHTRDPRQSMISWIHHLDKLHTDQKYIELYFTYEELPENYFDLRFEEKVDVQMDLFYAQSLNWIDGWLDAETCPDHGLKIHFSHFRKLKEDEEGFFKELFEFWEMDPQLIEGKSRKPDEEKDHKRAGKLNEWMQVLTPAQIERACDMMPDRIANRYDWVKTSQEVERELAQSKVVDMAA